MATPDPLQGASPDGSARFKSFDELARYLREVDDPEQFVYSLLEFGAVFWIPDEDSGFGKEGGQHPWVIVFPYRAGQPQVTACPRTSTGQARTPAEGFSIPADVVPGLNKEGVVLLNKRRPFPIAAFRHYELIGSLPEAWQERLHAALARIAAKTEAESEGP